MNQINRSRSQTPTDLEIAKRQIAGQWQTKPTHSEGCTCKTCISLNRTYRPEVVACNVHPITRGILLSLPTETLKGELDALADRIYNEETENGRK